MDGALIMRSLMMIFLDETCDVGKRISDVESYMYECGISFHVNSCGTIFIKTRERGDIGYLHDDEDRTNRSVFPRVAKSTRVVLTGVEND